MGQMIRDIMTTNPITLGADSTLQEAAHVMRDSDIGSILVVEDGARLCGIVTDRDIVVRGLGEDRDPKTTTLREVCSQALAHLTPDDEVAHAIKLMGKKGIRRIPVMEGERAVGVVSLGDLALARDQDSALGGISAREPNT